MMTAQSISERHYLVIAHPKCSLEPNYFSYSFLLEWSNRLLLGTNQFCPHSYMKQCSDETQRILMPKNSEIMPAVYGKETVISPAVSEVWPQECWQRGMWEHGHASSFIHISSGPSPCSPLFKALPRGNHLLTYLFHSRCAGSGVLVTHSDTTLCFLIL